VPIERFLKEGIGNYDGNARRARRAFFVKPTCAQHRFLRKAVFLNFAARF
jgi:hypothetical protein